MEMKLKLSHAFSRALGMSLMLMTTGVMTTGMLQGSVILWANGSPSPTPPGSTCDGQCGSQSAPVSTIFESFSVTGPWVVTGFDYTDFFTVSDTVTYSSTKWSIWKGDPLSAGTLVAAGSAFASLGPLQNCSNGLCLVQLTVSGLSVQLSPGVTYYLGTSTLGSGATSSTRALASGNGQPGYEWSNGTTTGVVGSTWTPGTANVGPAGVETAFDIIGTTPEPGTITLMGFAMVGLCLVAKRRSMGKATA